MTVVEGRCGRLGRGFWSAQKIYIASVPTNHASTMCHPVHIKYRQKQEHNEGVLDLNRRVCEKNRRFIGKTNRLG